MPNLCPWGGGQRYLNFAPASVFWVLMFCSVSQCSKISYFLMSCKAGWRENQATFMNEVKNLQATGLSTLGTSLKEAFDLLNLYRLHSGIDNYGMVR